MFSLLFGLTQSIIIYPPTASALGTFKIYLPLVMKSLPVSATWYMNKPADSPQTPYNPYNLGYTVAQTDTVYIGGGNSVLEILAFGQPCSVTSGGSTVYGAYLWDKICYGTGEVLYETMNYINGYCAYLVDQYPGTHCGPYFPTGPMLHLVIGTSNCTNGGSLCTNPSQDTNVSYQHGVYWALMLNSLNSYLANSNYSYQIVVSGGIDAELNWNTQVNTRNWVNGYSATTSLYLYDFGACECSLGYNPNYLMPNGWTYEDVWYVSFGNPNSFPAPEIYNTTGANASQWQGVSHYGAVAHHAAVYFPGVLTESGACSQVSSCAGIDNTPLQGMTQLRNALNQDSLTRDIALYSIWSTDIAWYPSSSLP